MNAKELRHPADPVDYQALRREKGVRERGARGTDADKGLPSNGTGRFTEKAQEIAVSTAAKVDM